MGDDPSRSRRIGIICDPDHAVFGVVAQELRERGHRVEFLEPGVELPPERLDRQDVLVNKKVRWESLRALEYANRAGIAAWNGYVTSLLTLNRVSQLGVLDAVGFRTPAVHTSPPEGDYVAKGFMDIGNDPILNGEGDFYEPLLDADGPDHKYYTVDDGDTVHAAVVQFESKLRGERELVGTAAPDPDVVDRLERLLRFVDARALGVDLIRVAGDWVAFDINPATSFKHTGLESALAESICSRFRD